MRPLLSTMRLLYLLWLEFLLLQAFLSTWATCKFLSIPEKANFASSPSMTPSKTILSSVILKPTINYGKINKKIKTKSFWPASKKYICSTAPILNATAELPISRPNNSTNYSSNNTSITWVISFRNKLILKESPSYFSTFNSKSLKTLSKQPEKSRLLNFNKKTHSTSNLVSYKSNPSFPSLLD